MKFLSVLSVTIALLAGCTTFRSPGVRSTNASIIRESFRSFGTPGALRRRSTSLMAVDGKEMPTHAMTFYVAPGSHRMKVSCSEEGGGANLYATFTLHAHLKPKHVYELSYVPASLGGGQNTCEVQLIDVSG